MCVALSFVVCGVGRASPTPMAACGCQNNGLRGHTSRVLLTVRHGALARQMGLVSCPWCLGFLCNTGL
jgi:hypothetical protein